MTACHLLLVSFLLHYLFNFVENSFHYITKFLCSYVMGIGEAEAFSERLKRELQALEAANVHAILESEPLIEEVLFKYKYLICLWKSS